MDPPSKQSTRNETFPNPYYLYFPITSTIAYMVVSMFWLGPFRVLSDSVLRDRVLFRVLSDRILFRVLFRVLSDRVLFRVLSDSALIRFSVLVLCCVPSVISTTWGVLQWFSVLNISIATDVLILSLGNLMQLTEIWASFWNEKKRLYPRFLTGFWIHLCRIIYI